MQKTIHKVYWTEDNVPRSQDEHTIDGALKLCEMLRRSGEKISFVTISSQIADCVSLQGVGVTDASYDWKKRRR